MADITDAQAIRYVNEVIRPLAETMRALKARVDSGLTTWYADISALIPNDSSPLLDGREDDGVSRLTGIDINSFVVQMAAYKTALEQSGVPGVISKPCVRALDAS